MITRDPEKGPDFLIVGAARSGTSWLARNLALHPEIYIPTTKELHFFDQHFDLGYEWFENQLISEKPIRGEATPAYMYFDGVAQRIFEAYPGVKLIALLRNPVDRAYSHYQNLKAKSHGDMPGFLEKLDITPRLLREGMYAERLQPFFQKFPSNQIHVELFDEVQANPQPLLVRICQFLGATSPFEFPLAQNRINSANMKLSNAFLRKTIYRLLIKAKMGTIAKTMEDRLVNDSAGPLPGERRRLYLSHFKEDVKKLESLINLDLKQWIPKDL